jgi:hypothetical protein
MPEAAHATDQHEQGRPTSAADVALSDDVLAEVLRVEPEDADASREAFTLLRSAARLIQQRDSWSGYGEAPARDITCVAAALALVPGHRIRQLGDGWIARDALASAAAQLIGLARPTDDSGRIAVHVAHAIREATRLHYLDEAEYDAWQPGMRSGSGMREAVAVTALGRAKFQATPSTGPAELIPSLPARPVPTTAAQPSEPVTSARPTTRKRRPKAEVVHASVLEHLVRRPHDTAAEVAAAVQCGVGTVAEAPAWKLNRRRLEIARKCGIDPIGIALNERAVNEAGGSASAQARSHREATASLDESIDAQDQTLNGRIGAYQQDHPDATPQQVAAAVGCTAGEVERRQAMLTQLASEQANDHLEDTVVEDLNTQSQTRQQWVAKRT